MTSVDIDLLPVAFRQKVALTSVAATPLLGAHIAQKIHAIRGPQRIRHSRPFDENATSGALASRPGGRFQAAGITEDDIPLARNSTATLAQQKPYRLAVCRCQKHGAPPQRCAHRTDIPL